MTIDAATHTQCCSGDSTYQCSDIVPMTTGVGGSTPVGGTMTTTLLDEIGGCSCIGDMSQMDRGISMEYVPADDYRPAANGATYAMLQVLGQVRAAAAAHSCRLIATAAAELMVLTAELLLLVVIAGRQGGKGMPYEFSTDPAELELPLQVSLHNFCDIFSNRRSIYEAARFYVSTRAHNERRTMSYVPGD